MDDVITLLRNWGNWARTRRHYSHCYSIEGRYRSPQVWYPPGPRVMVDELSALAVERTMRHIPYLHRLALKLIYVWKVPARTARRAVCVPHNLWDQFLGDACLMVENRLNRLTSRNQGNNLESSTDLPPALSEPDGSGCYGEKEAPDAYATGALSFQTPTDLTLHS